MGVQCARMRQFAILPTQSRASCSHTAQFSVVRAGTPLKASPAVESDRVRLTDSAAWHLSRLTFRSRLCRCLRRASFPASMAIPRFFCSMLRSSHDGVHTWLTSIASSVRLARRSCPSSSGCAQPYPISCSLTSGADLQEPRERPGGIRRVGAPARSPWPVLQRVCCTKGVYRGV